MSFSKKNVATLSQRLEQIPVRIHQYMVRIKYKLGPDLFMADWLSRHHSKNKDEEIMGMQISMNAIQSTTNVPECMTMHELQGAMSQDQHLKHLIEYVIQGWPESKNQQPQDIRTYWMFRDDIAVIDGTVIKGKCIGIWKALQ